MRAGLRGVALALVITAAVARAALGVELHLRLEPNLSDPERAVSADPAGAASSAPFVLGLTNLRDRVSDARSHVEAWREANRALAAHLAERERHLEELRSFVVLQENTIAALETGVNALAASDPAPVPVAVELATPDPAPVPVAVGVRPTGAAATGAAPAASPTASPYLEAGLVAAMVAVLAWALYLRAQVRARERELAAASPPFDARRPPDLGHEVRGAAPRRGGAARGPTQRAQSSSPSDAGAFDLLIGESDEEGGSPSESPAGAPAPARSADGHASPGAAGRTRTDVDALKEVDTLIAFEDHERAAERLNELLSVEPRNPEYRLRLLHILSTRGDWEASAEQEQLLESMMDAPLSETLSRVQRIGRDLLPGHRLFGPGAAHEEREASRGQKNGRFARPEEGRYDLSGELPLGKGKASIGPTPSENS